MIEQISKSEFCHRFVTMDRRENFSYEARELLFDYLEEANPESEIDVIAVCCEFREADADEIISDYALSVGDDEDPETVAREYLEDNTILVGETASGFVFVGF